MSNESLLATRPGPQQGSAAASQPAQASRPGPPDKADASRIQKRHGGENFALLRRLALGLLKQHPSKESIRCKRYQAAMDAAFLEEVLKQKPAMGKLQ